MDYVTIDSTGNATDFGDLTETAAPDQAAVSSSTRGLRMGGRTPSYVMSDCVTIASTGNATDFGDLTETVGKSAALSSNTIAVRNNTQTPK